VDRCQAAGLVEGEHLSVDGSFIPANASRLRLARYLKSRSLESAPIPI
jgi:hypothetical protein